MIESTNIYQQARLEYNEKLDNDLKQNKLTQEKVAEYADTSLSTIKRIESGEILPSPELLIKLSEMYHNTKILRVYCSDHCALGQYYNKDSSYEFQPTSLFEAGYGLINANKELDSFKNELFDILSDGIVTDDEIERLKEIMVNLDKVQHIVDVIKDMINDHVSEQ